MSFKCLGVLDATGGSGRACACTAVGRGGEQWSDLLGVKDALPKQWHKTEIFYVIKRSVKIFSVHYETVARQIRLEFTFSSEEEHDCDDERLHFEERLDPLEDIISDE